MNLCLSSFGCSRPQNNFKLDNELLGTFNYMAPEVVKVYMKKDEGEIEGYDGMKVDIWSLGLVLFRMLGELFPYDGPFKESLPFSSISNLDSYQPFPVIYLKCTQIEPINRPSVNQLLSLI